MAKRALVGIRAAWHAAPAISARWLTKMHFVHPRSPRHVCVHICPESSTTLPGDRRWSHEPLRAWS
jgi:hypothetical protein